MQPANMEVAQKWEELTVSWYAHMLILKFIIVTCAVLQSCPLADGAAEVSRNFLSTHYRASRHWTGLLSLLHVWDWIETWETTVPMLSLPEHAVQACEEERAWFSSVGTGHVGWDKIPRSNTACHLARRADGEGEEGDCAWLSMESCLLACSVYRIQRAVKQTQLQHHTSSCLLHQEHMCWKYLSSMQTICPNHLHGGVGEELWCTAANAWGNALPGGEWEEYTHLDASVYAIFIIATRNK